MASKVRGGKVRRLLRNMPDGMRNEIVSVFDSAGPQVQRLVQQRIAATTKTRSGKLRAGVKWKVLRQRLRLQVGFLGTPRGRAKLFYARILDLGRRAQTVTVSRRRAGAPVRTIGGRKPRSDVASVYQLRVTAIKPKRFVTSGAGELRRVIGARLRGAFDRVLRKLSAGDLE